MMEVHIRKVKQGDADTLAYIQTESWKAAFEAPAGQVKWLFYCPHWLT